jgi:1,4-dihydroxy-2-naphthoate octaprenyltransferase
MLSRSSWLHLRIPFSYYLFPVFFFSLAISPNVSEKPLLWTFIIIHLFLYPASNGYNSYFDKDEGSIGGLKNPPKVSKGLYYLSLTFDLIALILAIVQISLTFAVMIFIYGMVSKAYSHPAVRLKKYPIASWLIVSLFQGMFTFMMCYIGINRFPIETLWKSSVCVPAILSTALLLGTYPMTQIYQHEEDARRGDNTFSRMLGIRGTFLFVGAVFGIVSIGYILYFNAFFSESYAWAFLTALLPVVTFFFYWFLKVLRDESKADFKHTMWLNFLSATCLNIFFIYLWMDSTNIWQIF